MTHSRRMLPMALVTVLAALALTTLPRVPSDAGETGQEGSGGRAVAHHAGGAVIRSRSVTSKAPDARLYRTAFNASEPTLGLTKNGDVYYVAFQTNTKVEVIKSKDEGKSWDVVSPKLPGGRNTQLLSLDPYIYVDPRTDRVFTIDLTVACAYLSSSDDGGKSWQTNPAACGRPVNDHQTLFAGPPVSSPTVGYDNIVYYCWNDIGSSSCSKSLDGGVSFHPTGSPAFLGVDSDGGQDDPRCGGLHGHGYVDDKGNVYIPKGQCGQPWLAISHDEGATWDRVQVASNGSATHEGSVAVDPKGNIYYAWIASDRLPYLSVSKNDGKSWSKPMMVGAPGVNETNLPSLDVGGVGKVAIAYMGTTNSPGQPFPAAPECTAIQVCGDPDGYGKTTWNGYITMTAEALDKAPVFYSGTVNDPKDPLIRGACGPGRCKAVFDFIDVVIGPDGTPWTAFVDGCILACAVSGPNNQGSEGVVGRLVGGPSLR